MDFVTELESLINRHSQENDSNTPDFILANYLLGCLEVWNKSVVAREYWYGRAAIPGRIDGVNASPSDQSLS